MEVTFRLKFARCNFPPDWLDNFIGNLRHFPEEPRHEVVVVSPGEYLERLGTA